MPKDFIEEPFGQPIHDDSRCNNNSIDQDEHGSLYISGYSTSADNGVDSVKRAVILKVDKNDLVSTGELETYLKPIPFTVYPNPFSSETTLHTDHLLQGATLTVYNSHGQVVKELDHLSGNTITLTRDNLPAGLYNIQLTQDDRIIASTKIIIQ